MAATVDQKLLKSTKFPPEFNKKVDMKKVNIEVMKKCVQLAVSAKIRASLTDTDGLPERCQRSSLVKMTSSPSYASTCLRRSNLCAFLSRHYTMYCH